MIGGFNKILRNLASLKGKSEFEKRLIKASYSGDMKEPKEKHLICNLDQNLKMVIILVILECLKGKHLELIRPKEALSKLFERFFNNLKSISLMLKALCILHRALQEEDISQMVAHRIKEKENLLYPCQKEDLSYDTKMQCFICELYIEYIKNLINFIIICQLFSINLKDLHHYTKNLQVKELFLIFSRIDGLIENILKVFEQKSYCQNYRLLHHIIYLLFVDLLKIYQSYYLLITVMLEKFDDMHVKDQKRAFIIYLNFVKINKEIRKMTSCIVQEFNISLNVHFYEVDTKLVEAMKLAIEQQEKDKSKYSDSGSPTSKSASSLKSKDYKTKIEFQTEEKNIQKWDEIQGQGMQGKRSPTIKLLKQSNQTLGTIPVESIIQSQNSMPQLKLELCRSATLPLGGKYNNDIIKRPAPVQIPIIQEESLQSYDPDQILFSQQSSLSVQEEQKSDTKISPQNILNQFEENRRNTDDNFFETSIFHDATENKDIFSNQKVGEILTSNIKKENEENQDSEFFSFSE